MVTIVDYALRQTAEGKEFFALVLQSGIDMVLSKTTGRYYATSKQTTVPSTFNESTCKSLVGEKIPGVIVREACEPYSYTVKETGEILELSHHWVYYPEPPKVEPVFQGKITHPLVAEFI